MAALKYLFALEELYPPFRVDTTVLFAQELNLRHHHNIRWVFLAEDDTVESGELEWAGGQAYVIKNLPGDTLTRKVFRQFRNFFVDFRFFLEAIKNDWDFIQTRDRFFGGVLGVLASRIKGVKFFFWLSFPFPEMYETRAKEGMSRYPIVDRFKASVTGFFLYKIIARYADHIFVQSDQMKSDLIAKGVNPEKMTPVPMGISSSEIEIFTRNNPRIPVKKRIVYLGTLARDRKLDFLVRVNRIVVDALGDVEMLFVGDGDEPGDRDIIQQEAINLGVEDSIHITGKLPRSEAWEYVRNAAVCLSPFFPTPILNSTSPTKIIEYMALGSPVVANDHPEQSKLISESDAGICVSWDEKEFAEAIIQILTDDQLSMSMSKKGEKYAIESRDYKVIADILDDKYSELCSR